MRGRSGFSILELMVAVGIIGVSAAILIPNYNRMVSRSRTSEVKVGLSKIYLIQKNFALEHSTYTQCLRQIGLNQPSSLMYYTVGINPSGPWDTCGPASSTSCLYTRWNPTNGAGTSALCAGTDGAIVANATAGNGYGVPTIANIAGSSVSRDQFIAGGVARISSSASSWDRWTIDHTKNVQQTLTGT